MALITKYIVKNKIFIGLAVLGLVLAGTAAAQTATTSATATPGYRLGKPLQGVKEEYQDKIRAIREEAKDKRDEIKDARQDIKNSTGTDRDEKFKELREIRIKAFVDKIIKRLNAALERSRKFVARLEQHLTQRADKGADTSAVDKKLDEASATITAGQAKVDAIIGEVDKILTGSSTPREAFGSVRTAVGTAIDGVKAAHQKIVEAIRLLKTLPGNTATSTATSTGN